jgi:hypothetical protein
MRQARVLLVVSVMALLVGPVVMLLGALSTNVLLMGTVLLIMGALGLFAGMRQISRQ